MDALLTLSSKGQLVIPARLRQLLGLQAGDRLELSLEADGLRLVPPALHWVPGAAPGRAGGSADRC